MISPVYNLKPVIDTRSRWQWCTCSTLSKEIHSMNTQVEFKTKMFPEREGEAEENINGFIGMAFCEWIRDELPKHGYGTKDEIIPEDFGWLCYLDCEHPLWIGCNNNGIDDDGFTSYIAMIVAEFPKKLFRKSPDPKPDLERAVAALRSLIESEPRIKEAAWFAS